MSETPEQEQTKPRKRSKLPLVAGLAAGLILGGGGAAGYFLFLTGGRPAPPQPVAQPAAKAPPKTFFVKVDRLSAPLVDGQRVVAYVLLDLSLEIKDSDVELMIAQRMPALRDAFLREMTRTTISRADQPLIVDFDALAERLRSAANAELQRDGVLRVLVTQTTRL